MSDTLEDRRRQVAEAALEEHCFDDQRIEDSSGWEFASDENRINKPLIFASETEEESELGSFIVEFYEGSDDMIEAYALLNGEVVGHQPSPGMRP